MAPTHARRDASISGNVVTERRSNPTKAGVLADATVLSGVDDELKPGGRASHGRPWYKTPSVWWLLPITTLSAMFRASRTAPQTELFIKFACDELRPEYHVGAGIAQWGSTPRSTQVDIPLTFVQRNPILDDQILKSTLLHPDKRCAQDSEVQRAAAKLSAGITSAQGILSCLTLGWWTQYSDRAGRTRVLAITALAVLVADAVLYLVAFRADTLPGGYRLLIMSGALEGLSGGISACMAAGHAYIADCSSPLTRSRILSIWTGCVYAGVALGPGLGSLINYYSNNLLSIFYIATGTHVIYGIFVVFFVPESLSDEARAKAKELYEADMNLPPRTILGSLWMFTSFVRPLSILIPKRAPTGRESRKSKDWNLALLGAAAAVVAINAGSNDFQYQYALKAFHWSSVQLGHWLSLVGFWRALYLSIILPLIIKALYARDERTSNNTDDDDEKEAQVKKIDLMVVRSSLLVVLIGYTLVGIVTSQVPFIGATIILAFGGGFDPSVQSLALALASPSAHITGRDARDNGETPPPPLNAKQEIGRLFGALAVINSLGAQVVGPALFSTIFGATVGAYPRAIFWLCAVMVALALGALSVVRLDSRAMAKHSAERQPLLA